MDGTLVGSTFYNNPHISTLTTRYSSLRVSTKLYIRLVSCWKRIGSTRCVGTVKVPPSERSSEDHEKRYISYKTGGIHMGILKYFTAYVKNSRGWSETRFEFLLFFSIISAYGFSCFADVFSSRALFFPHKSPIYRRIFSFRGYFFCKATL